MGKNHLYFVRLNGANSNPDWSKFLENVNEFKAKATDYSAGSAYIIKHHIDLATLKPNLINNIRNEDDVIIEEITDETIASDNYQHKLYSDLIYKYFLPYDEFENIKPQ